MEPRERARRRVALVLAVLAAVIVVVVVLRNLSNDASGRPTAGPVKQPESADLDRARLCLAKAAEPGTPVPPVERLRLRYSDAYGDVLVVQTAQWESYCKFDPDGQYHGLFRSGTVLFPPAFLPDGDPAAPIKRLSSGGGQITPGMLEFEDAGRITAAVKAVRIACAGQPPVPAVVSGSMYYGRIHVPDDPRKKEEDACAAEALDATGTVLGHSRF